MKVYKLKELADYLNLPYKGNPDIEVNRLEELEKAGEGSVTFYHSAKLKDYLKDCKAGIIILKEEDSKEITNNVILASDPYYAYAKLSKLFDCAPLLTGIASTAVVGAKVELGENVSLGEHVCLGNGVKLGNNVVIEAGCVVRDNVQIGDEVHLYPNVVIYHGVRLGNRVIIHSGSVIGADGFGNANVKGRWEKIHQIGSVEIQDDVEIGANTAIDRGAIGDTVIETGARIDNLVQIAHNVRIGAHTAIAGCVGIAGSTEIGKHCLIGGGTGIAGHLKIDDGVVLMAMTGVSKSLTKGIYASVFPAFPYRKWWKLVAIFSHLDELIKKFKPSSWWQRLKQKFSRS